MNWKKQLPLIIGLLIPVVMILAVALSIYIPRASIHPRYNFLYTDQDQFQNREYYTVENTTVVKKPIPLVKNDPGYYSYPPRPNRLYLYNTQLDTATEISLEDAQKLRINPNLKSRDDYEVIYGNRSEGVFPFFFGPGTDYDSRYLKGHNAMKKLNLSAGYPNNNFNFLGWIE